MRGWLLIVGVLTGLRSVAAPDTLRLGQLTDKRPLRQCAQLITTSPTADWSAAWAAPAQPAPARTDGRFAYWWRLAVQNNASRPQTLYVFGGNNATITCYALAPGPRLLSVVRTGSAVPADQWSYRHHDQYVPVPLAAGQTATLLVRVANRPGVLPFLTPAHLPRPSLNAWIETESQHAQQALMQYRDKMPEMQYRYWVQGALLFFLFLVLLLYGHYREPLYGYYALYVLAGVSYSLLKNRLYTPVGQWVAHWPLLRMHGLETIIWAGWGAYLFFLVELLSLRQSHPRVARRLRRWGRGAALYAGLTGTLLVLTNDGVLYQIIYWLSRGVIIPLHIGVLVWTVRHVPSVLTRYVLAGNVALVTIGLLASLRLSEVILPGQSLPGYVDNLLMLPLGVLLEIIAFALAMGHRVRLIDRDRAASQAAYIEELEQRTAYQKRLAEVEVLALRSQMNPHFLFNSLNTIEYFVLKGDEDNATRYLTSFSRLLRMILSHSREETILLSEELDALALYLTLEAARFDKDFAYSIDVDPAVLPADVAVPPLLLQPFVENAIWHGLLASPRPDKRLWVRIRPVGQHTLQFEIEDNGIGRAQAAALQSRSISRRKSYGMAITSQRIELFNRRYASQMHVSVADGPQTGTLVIITYSSTPVPDESHSA